MPNDQNAKSRSDQNTQRESYRCPDCGSVTDPVGVTLGATFHAVTCPHHKNPEPRPGSNADLFPGW